MVCSLCCYTSSITITMIRRRIFCSHNYSSTSSPSVKKKKSVVLLGAPKVSAIVLEALLNAQSQSDSLFEVSAIVTQPPSKRDRGKLLMPSPLAQFALQSGFDSHLIFTPQRAGEDDFLSDFKALQPDLCVTAAYGNILPTKFLDIPPLGEPRHNARASNARLLARDLDVFKSRKKPLGTVNIHPSLLPMYRGAAPVQRALQDGVKETGVSLAFTVRALDAGPIIATETVQVDDQIKAPELLDLLFYKGSKLLIGELPSIFDGSARVKAHPQDDSKATLAPKISQEESWLLFDQEALVLHNKVRAFSGWPGTRAKVSVVEKNGQQKTLEIKIITTRVSSHISVHSNEENDISFVDGALAFPCGCGSILEVLEVQLPGKKVVSAAAFWNGLQGKKLKKL